MTEHPPFDTPWSGVQFTADGVWGAVLNTSNAKEHLTTTTLESQFSGCHDVWKEDGTGGFHVGWLLLDSDGGE